MLICKPLKGDSYETAARDGNGREMGQFQGKNEGSMYADLDIVVCAI